METDYWDIGGERRRFLEVSLCRHDRGARDVGTELMYDCVNARNFGVGLVFKCLDEENMRLDIRGK